MYTTILYLFLHFWGGSGGSGYNCDFSRDNCGWQQVKNGDQFDWSRHRGPTTSTSTGPRGDHTDGSNDLCFHFYLKYVMHSVVKIAFMEFANP